jgi:hypothetical protein
LRWEARRKRRLRRYPFQRKITANKEWSADDLTANSELRFNRGLLVFRNSICDTKRLKERLNWQRLVSTAARGALRWTADLEISRSLRMPCETIAFFLNSSHAISLRFLLALFLKDLLKRTKPLLRKWSVAINLIPTVLRWNKTQWRSRERHLEDKTLREGWSPEADVEEKEEEDPTGLEEKCFKLWDSKGGGGGGGGVRAPPAPKSLEEWLRRWPTGDPESERDDTRS